MARLKLDELAGGAAQEKFDRSFSKVAQNLMVWILFHRLRVCR